MSSIYVIVPFFLHKPKQLQQDITNIVLKTNWTTNSNRRTKCLLNTHNIIAMRNLNFHSNHTLSKEDVDKRNRKGN